jgi:hypothetical protein
VSADTSRDLCNALWWVVGSGAEVAYDAGLTARCMTTPAVS